jgi:hypothetical protein
MKNRGNTMNLHDVELFDMTTNNWCNFGRGTTATWKRDDILDKVFVRLAKKLEKKVKKSENNA